MAQYKVKNFSNINSMDLQKEISNWIETRDHISTLNVNMWADKVGSYCTIVYLEKEYNL